MADGRGRTEWARAAWLMALIANVNRDPKQRRQPFQPEDFNPYDLREKKPKRKRLHSMKEGKAGIMAAFGITKVTKVSKEEFIGRA